MSFADDIKSLPVLAGALCKGLSALRPADRRHITKRQSTRLAGSVDLDSALKAAEPAAPRWDYVIGELRQAGERLHWVEVHPANGTSHIGEMAKKLAWLHDWMRKTPLHGYERRIVWAASGRSAFNSRHPALKGLANQGLAFAGGRVTI
ncbi:MAG: hypothetical protein DPW12_10575 [Rhodocyclaceae bacterium]|nr:hypothetical protein [Candidatus Hydrogenedentota bacterium]MCG3167981.1 hypothetical protein [Bacteroidia bacterium]MCQ3924623.1 hypothetical protein [Rhodocyclaceae bacterium]